MTSAAKSHCVRPGTWNFHLPKIKATTAAHYLRLSIFPDAHWHDIGDTWVGYTLLGGIRRLYPDLTMDKTMYQIYSLYMLR